jgi:hypothetical protein
MHAMFFTFVVLVGLLRLYQFPALDTLVTNEPEAILPMPLPVVNSFITTIPDDKTKTDTDMDVNDAHSHFHFDFPMCLVHIGKAAGSSVSCGLGFMYADCEGMPRQAIPDSFYFHMRRNNCPIHTQTYLVTLRNPLTRLQSWFDFEKEILPTRKNPKQQQHLQWKRAMLFVECYKQFDDLALYGLRPLKDNTINATKPQDMTCPQRAWAAVLGARDFSYHEWYNYEHYWNAIVQPTIANLNVTVKVLRTEHLLDDWTGLSTEPLYRRVNQGSDHTNTTTTTPIPKFVPLALQNLCRALCHEIQIYKQLLTRADNLNDAQVQESLKEVQESCPDEKMLHTRECPGIPTFPLIPVPRRQYQSETKKRLFQVISKKKKRH